MAGIRQQNWISQQRVDLPHLRSIESAIAADFDVLAGRVQGGSQALVVRGFALLNAGPGVPVSTIQLNTADGILYNINATESGTFLWVPADRAVELLDSVNNPKVDGSFTASQVNYIGLDYSRTADTTTSDLVQVLDANTLLEQPKTLPLGRILDYRIVITTIPFSSTPNIIPIAKIKTDANNTVDSLDVNAVQDARNMMFRLGRGGDFPNQYEAFSWPSGRKEYDSSVVALQTVDKFVGGDKAFLSQKDWMDSVMTRLWELGGGQNWYSPTADRNIRLVKRRDGLTMFTSTGDNFEWVGGANLHWKGLTVLFDNSNGSLVFYNTITDQTGNAANLTDLADGECLYVDLDRTTNATLIAVKGQLQTLGEPVIPGSRFVFAWRKGAEVFCRDSQYPVNTAILPATTSTVGGVVLAYTSGTPSAPVVVNLRTTNAIKIGYDAFPITAGNNGISSLVTTANALYGEATGAAGIGFYGYSSGAGGKGGEFHSALGNGLEGYASGAANCGVLGTNAIDGSGVKGVTQTGWGVYGEATGATGIASYGIALDATGIGAIFQQDNWGIETRLATPTHGVDTDGDIQSTTDVICGGGASAGSFKYDAARTYKKVLMANEATSSTSSIHTPGTPGYLSSAGSSETAVFVTTLPVGASLTAIKLIVNNSVDGTSNSFDLFAVHTTLNAAATSIRASGAVTQSVTTHAASTFADIGTTADLYTMPGCTLPCTSLDGGTFYFEVSVATTGSKMYGIQLTYTMLTVAP